ncbi:hypothetical protein AEQU3_00882 [Aequorivita antarctica]|nr:hypothetical protein AEQU3_00882 [Aequorivita antarctica]
MFPYLNSLFSRHKLIKIMRWLRYNFLFFEKKENHLPAKAERAGSATLVQYVSVSIEGS